VIDERRVLQGLVLLGGLVPVGAGLGGALFGADLTQDTLSVTGDSHYRYLSGLLLAIGLGFWSTVPAIERKSGRFRLLTAIVLMGGLARLAGLAAMGVPSVPMLAALTMELLVTPGLCLWQGRIARLARAAGELA